VRREAEQALQAPTLLSDEERRKIRVLGADLSAIWEAPTTTNRDRKRLLRCLIEEVQLRVEQTRHAVRIVWKGGGVTEREVVRGKPGWAQRTQEDTIALVRELAREFDDAQSARILNKQGRRSGLGNPFTQPSVTSLRGKHGIAKCPHKIAQDPIEGPFTADEAARELGVTMSTCVWHPDKHGMNQPTVSPAPAVTEDLHSRRLPIRVAHRDVRHEFHQRLSW
jgi:hypothetical protein